MEAIRFGKNYRVTVHIDEVLSFAKKWPGHHFDLDAEYAFEFDAKNGDLVEIEKYIDGKLAEADETEDGPEFVAMSDDACEFGARELGLSNVLEIRFGETSGPRP